MKGIHFKAMQTFALFLAFAVPVLASLDIDFSSSGK